VIEVSSSIAALWRLRSDMDPVRRARVEALTLRLIGLSLLALALYVLVDAARALYLREAPERTVAGIVVAGASVLIMPMLARAKRRIGIALGSRALVADAMQTSLCAWLSVIVLVGLGLNALLGWWWADPVAAILMTPIIAKEGIEGLRGEQHCDDCR
jgi:divalent metal cation (Fe/Co/Zn/Cd) transporter